MHAGGVCVLNAIRVPIHVGLISVPRDGDIAMLYCCIKHLRFSTNEQQSKSDGPTEKEPLGHASSDAFRFFGPYFDFRMSIRSYEDL